MKKKTVRIRLNAFNKDSSTSYSESVEVQSVKGFLKAEKEFEQKVPFCRFYFDHEYEEGDRQLADKCLAASE